MGDGGSIVLLVLCYVVCAMGDEAVEAVANDDGITIKKERKKTNGVL